MIAGATIPARLRNGIGLLVAIDVTIRPGEAAARRFRAAGVWQDSGQISDLRRWRDRTPQATAIRAYRADGDATLLTYAELAGQVERFAGALYQLGIRPGRACQLPNWWQAHVLLLAATRLQAVVAPIMPTIRPRELQRMLHRVGACMCVTAHEWAGFDHAAALKEFEVAQRVEVAKCGTRLLPRDLTATRLRDKVLQAMTMCDGARRVAAGYVATGGAAHGADLIEQRLLRASA
jgi:non-ribosomal peptide synthetase component E (peptide arylation enzyme)